MKNLQVAIALLFVIGISGCGVEKEQPLDSGNTAFVKPGPGKKPGEGTGGLVNRNSYDLALYSFQRTHQVLDTLLILQGTLRSNKCKKVSPMIEQPSLDPGKRYFTTSVVWQNCDLSTKRMGQISGFEEFKIITSRSDTPPENKIGHPFDLKDIELVEVKTNRMFAYPEGTESQKIAFSWTLQLQKNGRFFDVIYLFSPETLVEREYSKLRISHEVSVSLQGLLSYENDFQFEKIDIFSRADRHFQAEGVRNRIEKIELKLSGKKIRFSRCQLLNGDFKSELSFDSLSPVKGYLLSEGGRVEDSLSNTRRNESCSPRLKGAAEPSRMRKPPYRILI